MKFLKQNLDIEFSMMEETVLNVMRDALVDFYLKTKNFEAIPKLYKENWKNEVLGGEYTEWQWALSNEKGDYFLPKTVLDELKEEARQAVENRSLSIYEKEPFFQIELTNRITTYIKENRPHYVLSLFQ